MQIRSRAVVALFASIGMLVGAGVACAVADQASDCGEQVHGIGPDATVSYTMCPVIPA